MLGNMTFIIISFDEETHKTHIHAHTNSDSQVHKMKRINTPTEHVHKLVYFLTWKTILT